MKSKIYKLFTLVLFFSVCITLFLLTDANEASITYNNDGLPVDVDAQIAAQSEAINNAIYVKSNLSPEQYAGMWIDEYHKLNIGFVSQYSMNFMKDKNVIYHEFRYTLKELLQFQNETFYALLASEEIEVQTLMLDESQNVIIATFDKHLENKVLSSKVISELIESKILIVEFSDTPLVVILD